MLKDSNWRLVDKEVTSSFRKVLDMFNAVLPFILPLDIGSHDHSHVTYHQAVNVHYSDKRLGRNSVQNQDFHFPPSHPSPNFLSFLKAILMLAFMKAYSIITFFRIP
ncbi:hypothetical protein ABKV19_023949 [Rosa sericea]